MPRSTAKRREPKLPWQQFSILALVRFSEPIAMTSVFPYLPAMIQSFPRVDPADVGFWTGTAAAIFSLAQCFTAIAWGRASDRFGRKPVILLGLLNTMLTSLLWGFSTNLPMALTARALSGAGNGNVGIIRTMIAELCPWKELQPRAFSLMPLVYSVGSVIGPSIGGALANPLRRSPEDTSAGGSLLWRFPYALPNIVSASFFLIGITIGILFLQETLESRRNKPDWGLVIGRNIVLAVRSSASRLKRAISRQPVYTAVPTHSPSHSRVVSRDLENAKSSKKSENGPRPTYSSVLTYQTSLYLLAYTILATHNTGFDQIISVLLHHPRSGKVVKEPTLPFFFNRGFGLDTGQIGVLFTINGFVGVFVQFVIFPPTARYFGTLTCLRAIMGILPFIYFITPFTTLIDDPVLAEIALFAIWMSKSACSIFAFPCCTILLTNTASSLKVLGTVNGIATSVGAIGRAIGPTLTGIAFTWGVKNNFLLAPFALLAIIGFLAWVPLYCAVEGDGFGNDDEDTLSDGEEVDFADDEDDAPASPISQRTVRLGRTNTQGSSASPDYEESEDEIGPLLTREPSRSFPHLQPTTSIASSVFTDTEDEGGPLVPSLTNSSLQPPGDNMVSPRLSRSGSAAVRPTRPRRRSSTPLGTGVGFRRLSSNLGYTRSGMGSGSELG
ncbi:MFS general substrate transporter [Microthyrium microscopicum]|uniref:MFS general substrate transporter n=1 Tax=Microthyrium microscopicum TaxID=703497 RepID=A0A6A6U239_9PEZI|nr:MFS general substrate transporter [Microthyrium microscopicum]